jgi:multimeric flavodoxin WrbA
LIISRSNRKGNTEYILDSINKNIEISELILLKEKNIEYCHGCLACHKIDYCVIKDDINEIIDKIIKANLIIFGVPNYFDNVSGLFKNFMDRLHPLYKSSRVANKKTIFVYVGGGNEIGTKEELHHSISGFVKYLKLDIIKEYSF